MVAYSFNKQFAQPIIDRRKKQTIRAYGKRPHAKPGDHLQLYVGMRTKQCKKIIPDVVCVARKEIEIYVHDHAINGIVIDGKWIEGDSKHDFAVLDGFASIDDMHSFWLAHHGGGTFRGWIIYWEDPAP